MNEWRNRIVRSGWIDPEQLLAHPLNYRIHPKFQTEALKANLDELGQYKPIVVQDGTDVVVDGHARVALALREGKRQIWCDFVDFDNAETNVALATGDPISALAEFDRAKYGELLHETTSSEAATMALLAQIAEREGVLNPNEPPVAEDPGAQIDRAEELRDKWQTSLGQLWEIGRHRILCGDSTDAGHIARLMGAGVAHGIFTSPPYDQQRTYEGNMASDWHALLVAVFDHACRVLAPGAQVFVNLGLVHRDRRVVRYWDSFIDWMESCDWPLFGWYVWDKQNGMPGDWNGRFAPAHEWIFHFASDPMRPEKTIRSKHAGDSVGRSQRNPDGTLKRFTGERDPIQPFKIPDSVVRLGPQRPDSLINNHPAPYPAELPSVFFNAWPNMLWLDPFVGSGTTLVAAERASCTAYGCELSPLYVAVALERLAGMGLEPRLVEADTLMPTRDPHGTVHG